MSNIVGRRISQMPLASSLAGNEMVGIVQQGESKRTTVNILLSKVNDPLLRIEGEYEALIERVSYNEASVATINAQKNAPNGYPGLTDGKLSLSVIPQIELGERFTVNSEAEMIALSARIGDIAVRMDFDPDPKIFLLTGNATNAADWINLTAVEVGVTTVAGKTGDVVIDSADIDDSSEIGRNLLTAADASAVRTLLELGSAAQANANSFAGRGEEGRGHLQLGTIATQDAVNFAASTHTHPVATTSDAGLMSASDKTKLDGLQSGGSGGSGDGSGVPTGSVMRFLSAMESVPEGFVELGQSAQTIPAGTWPNLDEIFGVSVTEPGEDGDVTDFVFDAELIQPDSVRHGFSLALSRDGSVLAVGASGHRFAGGVSNEGAVFIYRKVGFDWAQETILRPTDAPTSQMNFGHSVAISDDGNTIVVGARNHARNSQTSVGAAYVFRRSEGEWSGQLLSLPVVGSIFIGNTVSISGDGRIIAAGGHGDTTRAGRVHIVENTSGNDWVRTTTLYRTNSTTAGGAFGTTVCLSRDGTTLLVADPSGNTIYKYTQTGNSTLFEDENRDSLISPSNTRHGDKLAVNRDGSVFAASGSSAAGPIYVYRNSEEPSAILTRCNDVAFDDTGNLLVSVHSQTVVPRAGIFETFQYRNGVYEKLSEYTHEGDTGTANNSCSVSLSGDGKAATYSSYTNGLGVVYTLQSTTGPGEGGDGESTITLPAAPDSTWKWGLKT